MSLHARLVWSMVAGLVANLVLGGAIACFLAKRSVETEMRSALAVARQAVTNGIERLAQSDDPARDIDDLVASFRGNRHLDIFITGDDGATALTPTETAVLGDVPAWFIRLVGVAPEQEHVPVLIDETPRRVVLQTNPRNEILEVWGQLSGHLLILGLFCAQAVLLIPWLMRRALRPLDRIAAAFQRVGSGDYGERVHGRVAPELVPLVAGFNRMAEQLAAADAQNRALNEQLLSLQEQERGEIARDLHDEVGPFLFAVKVDASRIETHAAKGRLAEIRQCVHSIIDAVGHMQRQLRAILGRLQPTGLAELGLAAALEALVDFWRRRHPDIDWRLRIDPAIGHLDDEVAAATIYRVVQEALSNAVRHGHPSTISIAVSADGTGDGIDIRVVDDGSGMSEAARFGFGLAGMRERLRSLAGTLEYANLPEGGLALAARVPLGASRGCRAIQPMEAS